LNQRVRAEGAWLPPDAWDACLAAAPTNEPGSGRRAFIGLDLAAVSDMTALAIVTPTEDESFAVQVEYFMPADHLEHRAQQDRAPYLEWVQAGWITATPGNSTDYAYVAKRLHELMGEYDIQGIGVDPWSARQFVLQLQQDGLPIYEVQQSMRNLSHAVKEFERLVLGQRLRHDANPVLAWNIRNAVVELDANANVRLSKRRSTARIDGLSATITGLSQALVMAPSIYDSHGLAFIDLAAGMTEGL
jgi:phage terminase large subunit-like protein